MSAELYLVIGPPGTGKTTYLSRQVEHAAEKYAPGSILITSMTRAGVSEIARVCPQIPEENLGTLHAHAYRALDRPALAETPESIREWNTQHDQLNLSGAGTGLEDAPIEDQGRTRGDELHSAVMNHRARRTPREAWTPEQTEYAEHWDDFKRQTDRLDFTDLIEKAIAEVDIHPALPDVFLLDEAQDFSALELELAVQWARQTRTTIVVGDPDQTLYTWRGSDHDALQRLPWTGTRVLEQSYRVPRAVHGLAVDWIRQIAGRPDVAYRPTAQAGETRELAAALAYPEPLLDEIHTDLDEGRSAMVLTSCAYMLAPVISMLRKAGIPFHNPYRKTDGRWNPLRGAGALLAFLRPDDKVWGDQARLWTWDDVRLWTDPLTARGVLTRGSKSFIEEKCRPDRFGESQADTEVPTETVCELLEGASPATLRHPAFSLDVDWWASHLRASKAPISTYPLEVCRRHGGRALTDKPRVVVGTIHSVKGGEADSVYLAPDLSKQGYWNGWHGGAHHRDQIVRMIYVALTRARQRATILQPSNVEHVDTELLRHAYCDHVAKLYGIEVAQVLMGHADISTTRGYTGQLTLDELHRIVADTSFKAPPGGIPLHPTTESPAYRHGDSNPGSQLAEAASQGDENTTTSKEAQ